MSEELLKLIVEYIDAAIANAIDDGTSSDDGLTTFIAKQDALKALMSQSEVDQ